MDQRNNRKIEGKDLTAIDTRHLRQNKIRQENQWQKHLLHSQEKNTNIFNTKKGTKIGTYENVLGRMQGPNSPNKEALID